jgi:hypothetical protein
MTTVLQTAVEQLVAGTTFHNLCTADCSDLEKWYQPQACSLPQVVALVIVPAVHTTSSLCLQGHCNLLYCAFHISSHWKCLNKLRVTFTTSLAYEFTQVDQNNRITISLCFWSMDN